MKTTKKTLTFALVLAALLCLLVLSASAYDGTEYGSTGMYYKISNGEVTITDAKSDIKTADIPESIDDYQVTRIGDSAFMNCIGLTSITIPDSVTSIGKYAFYGTAWYDSQPYGDVYAGKVYYKYKGTMLSNTSITIKNGTKGIAGSAFSDCTGLTNITIPDSVTSIGDSAFEDCTCLTNVTIPNSVTRIGDFAFRDCTCLTNVTISDSVTSIGIGAFEYCTGLISVTIGNSVMSIGDYAFRDCTKLTSITIPESVTSIGGYAFVDTAWYDSQPYGDVYAGKVYYKYKGTMLANTKVTIKDGTNGIAGFAFNDCTGLISVTIPDSVTSIGGYAFADCYKLTSITIPDGVKSIGNSAFYDCTGLTSITIPDSVTSIGSDVFGLCSSLKGVYISDLAAWCNIEFKGSIPTFSYKLYLKGNPITNLVVPDDVISISDYAFSRCSGITSITISDSVMSVGDYAFSSCPLTTLKIGKGLKSIGKNAFSGIKVIPELYYAGSEEEWKGISIDSSNDLILRANMHYNADLSHTCSYTETVTKKATCTEDGVKTFTCNCGRTYTETIQATGHKYVTETHKATCTSIGVSIKKCKSCGIVVSATTTPATGHSTKTSALLTATETESGILVTSCETCGIITDASLINRIESVSLSKTSYTYNGKTQKPKVVIKTSKGKLLTEGKDYTVTVTFKGNYSGKKTLTFTIAPKAPTLKVKAGAKKATLSWNKQTGSSGYVVYMATSKNGKYKKLATVKGGRKTSYTAAKLTKGKTVYFKVVSYTASGKTTIRSAYSKPVGAKIK